MFPYPYFGLVFENAHKLAPTIDPTEFRMVVLMGVIAFVLFTRLVLTGGK